MQRRAWLAGVAVALAGCASGAPPERGDGAEPVPVAVEEPRRAPAAGAALEKGRELEKAGRPGDAEALYCAALADDSSDRVDRGTLHLRIALLAAQSGRRENAIHHAQAAVELRPDWDDARAVLEKVSRAPEKHSKAKPGKAPPESGGGVEDRLARVERKLAVLAEHFDAGAAKQKHAATDGARQEEEMLRKKLAEMKDAVRRMEVERGELKSRVKALEAEAAGLREEVAALREKLAAPK